MRKNVYFFQVNYAYGNSAHLPYTVAHLAAFAWQNQQVAEAYELRDMFFLREAPGEIIGKVDNPFLVGFSTYVWNYEYNKSLAKLIKDRFPECVIVFGGHHVPPSDDFLRECPFIDYLIHGEGEEPLQMLMLALIGQGNAREIPGISMRNNGGFITNDSIVMERDDFPSPYLEGYFDKILAENPATDFMALIETSRGCPYSCSYCDWSCMKSKIRQFPLERVFGEIEWISQKRVYGLGAADSNFGFYERDEAIADKIVEGFLATGRPVAFQTSYAKNSSERIFRIGRKLDKYGLNKGITLSFQSMSPTVLKNIGRENISIDFYKDLMQMYNKAGVSSYTELILGLPGETYESFADGIDYLLKLGQHNSLYIHNCECLPCSIMGTPDYIERFKIKSTRIPLNQPHRDYNKNDTITEWSQIITGTYSMDGDEWKKMNLFSFCVQAYHHMGLLKGFALYLYERGECSYRSFYEDLLEFVSERPDSVAGKTFNEINGYLDKTLTENGELVCHDEAFGNVFWPFEEYAFLRASYELDGFYEDLRDYLARYSYEQGVFEELLKFQKEIVKQPFISEKSFLTEYNFLDYFIAIQNNTPAVLEKKRGMISIKTRLINSWEEYAKSVVWFGRKADRNTYINEAAVKEMGD